MNNDKKINFFQPVIRLTWVIGYDLFEDVSKIMKFRLVFIFIGLSVLTTQQFIKVILSEKIVEKTDSASTGIAIFCSLIKLFSIGVSRKRFNRLYNTVRELILEQEKDEEDLRTLLRMKRNIRMVVICFLTLDGLAGSGAVFPSTFLNIMHPANLTLPMNSYFPYDPMKDHLVFGLSYFWLGTSTLTSAYNVGLMRITFSATGFYVSTQMSVLINHLRRLDPRTMGEEKTREDMVKIVKHHVTILRLAELMNGVYSYPHIIEAVLASIQSCLQLFQLMKVPLTDPRLGLYVPFLIGSVISLYLICFVGELLKTKSTQICEAAYDVPWHDMSPKLRKEFLCILRQSGRPLSLNVKGIFFMDMVLFLRTLQSAYTYMTLLTTTTE